MLKISLSRRFFGHRFGKKSGHVNCPTSGAFDVCYPEKQSISNLPTDLERMNNTIDPLIIKQLLREQKTCDSNYKIL